MTGSGFCLGTCFKAVQQEWDALAFYEL